MAPTTALMCPLVCQLRSAPAEDHLSGHRTLAFCGLPRCAIWNVKTHIEVSINSIGEPSIDLNRL